MIACGVAGSSYTRVKVAKAFVINKTSLDLVSSPGELAVIISIASSCLCAVLCLFLAALSLHQIKQPRVNESFGHVAISYIVSL